MRIKNIRSLDNIKIVIDGNETREVRIFSGNKNSILREVGECVL